MVTRKITTNLMKKTEAFRDLKIEYLQSNLSEDVFDSNSTIVNVSCWDKEKTIGNTIVIVKIYDKIIKK